MLTLLVLFLAAHLVLFRLTATVDDPALEADCLTALLDSLAAKHITHKEAYTLMSISKGQWSEICSGQRHTPSHTRMLNLPWRFWDEYIPRFTYIVAKRKVTEIASDLSLRRPA